jgi:hypothetical protein
MTTNVARGMAGVVYSTQLNPPGVALCYNQDTTVLTHTPAASQPRFDLIVARVYDETQGDSDHEWTLEIIEGVESATPVVPATPDNSMPLASVRVIPASTPGRGGASYISAAEITDLRYFAAGLGGTHLWWNTTPAPVATPGRTRFNVSTKIFEYYDGGVWRTFLESSAIQSQIVGPYAVKQAGPYTGANFVLTSSTSWDSTPPKDGGGSAPEVMVTGIKLPTGKMIITLSAALRSSTDGDASMEVSCQVINSAGTVVTDGSSARGIQSYNDTWYDTHSLSYLYTGYSPTETYRVRVVMRKVGSGSGNVYARWHRVMIQPVF